MWQKEAEADVFIRFGGWGGWFEGERCDQSQCEIRIFLESVVTRDAEWGKGQRRGEEKEGK